MVLTTAPSIFPEIMKTALGDLDDVVVYINDILILPSGMDTDDDHLHKCK
jgi:hypothetical protein